MHIPELYHFIFAFSYSILFSAPQNSTSTLPTTLTVPLHRDFTWRNGFDSLFPTLPLLSGIYLYPWNMPNATALLNETEI